MARPIVSVIISAKNEAERVEECFRSLRAQRIRMPFEVHFVDCASSDGTYRRAKSLATKNIFVWKVKKDSFATAFNFGAKKARGQVLLFSEASCLFSPGWITKMTKPLLQPQDYPLVALGGRNVQEFGSTPSRWEKFLGKFFDHWENDGSSTRPSFLPWASSSNLSVKSEIFRALGGFDESCPISFDVDFCWRLAMCGFSLGHRPDAIVRHFRQGSFRALLRVTEEYAYHNHSLRLTYEKLLGLRSLRAKKTHLQRKTQNLLALARRPQNLLKKRNANLLFALSSVKGTLEAKVLRAKPSVKFNSTRKGDLSKKFTQSLPRGYSHLHEQGWVYWKDHQTGDFMLFQPRKKIWLQLNDSAWKIWQVKSEGGQSEDAASALGEKEDDPQILRYIDSLTLDLHKERLLP